MNPHILSCPSQLNLQNLECAMTNDFSICGCVPSVSFDIITDVPRYVESGHYQSKLVDNLVDMTTVA